MDHEYPRGSPCIRCGAFFLDHHDAWGGAWCTLDPEDGGYFEPDMGTDPALVVTP